MLKLTEINVNYGQAQVLHEVSLGVAPGQIVCLIGANGAGKSTLLAAISGLVRPRSGRIIFNGQRIDRWPVDKIVRAGLVQVSEGRDIFTHLTVYQNLLLGGYTSRPRRRAMGELEKIYCYFPILKERSAQLAGTLSGGEQQMLAIGRALMARPTLLLLDEPSQGLAPIFVKEIFNILQAIIQEGTAVLLVEQNAVLALQRAAYGYILRNGRLVLEGRTIDLSADKMVQEHYLGSGTT